MDSGRSWTAIRVRRAVAALEANLVRTMRRRPFHEELGIEGHASARSRIELHHPAFDAVGIELRIDRAVERVGEVDAPAVAADLDHLRPTAERPGTAGM